PQGRGEPFGGDGKTVFRQHGLMPRSPYDQLLLPSPSGRGVGGEGLLARRWSNALTRNPINFLQDSLGFLQGLIIPETQHHDAHILKIQRPLRITLTTMLRTIKLDRQLRRLAIEVDDVGRQRVLTAKLQTAQPPRTQVIPETNL